MHCNGDEYGISIKERNIKRQNQTDRCFLPSPYCNQSWTPVSNRKTRQKLLKWQYNRSDGFVSSFKKIECGTLNLPEFLNEPSVNITCREISSMYWYAVMWYINCVCNTDHVYMTVYLSIVEQSKKYTLWPLLDLKALEDGHCGHLFWKTVTIKWKWAVLAFSGNSSTEVLILCREVSHVFPWIQKNNFGVYQYCWEHIRHLPHCCTSFCLSISSTTWKGGLAAPFPPLLDSFQQ